MRIEASHPPSAQTAADYRRLGYWDGPRSAAELEQAMSTGGQRTALIDNDSEWTFRELTAAVVTIRTQLGLAGVSAGDAVLVVTPLRNVAVAAYLATLHQGAVAVMLDRRCGTADVVHACTAVQPRIVLAFDDDAARLDIATHCAVLSLDRILAVDTETGKGPGIPLDPDAPAVVLFTSGTTNAPKGVVHSVNSIRRGAANMAEALGIVPQDALFLCSPLASITGVLQLHSTLAKHATLILEDRFSAERSLDRVRTHGATVIGGAPVIAQALFDECDRRDLQELPLRCLALGGMMIPQMIVDTARRFGVAAVRVYGSSEVPFSTATDFGDRGSPKDDGVPMAGVEVAIRDAGGTDELMIRGPHQFHGYLDPGHNADAFSGDWVRTGDQADVMAGRVTIKGRLKDVAIRKGLKISLSEIDSAAAILGDCAAFALPDETTGERLVLAIRTDAPSEITFRGMIDVLSSAGLATWKLPEQIVVWNGPFPRTASGKIVRRQLTDPTRHERTLYAPRIQRD